MILLGHQLGVTQVIVGLLRLSKAHYLSVDGFDHIPEFLHVVSEVLLTSAFDSEI